MTSYRTCTQPAKVCFHRGPQPTYADPACHLSAVEIVEDVPERPLQRPQIKRSGSMKHALSCQGAQDCEGSLWGRVASWIRCAAAAAISHTGFPLRRAQKDLRRTAWNRCRDGSRKTMTSSSKGCGNNKCCGNSSRTVFFLLPVVNRQRPACRGWGPTWARNFDGAVKCQRLGQFLQSSGGVDNLATFFWI